MFVKNVDDIQIEKVPAGAKTSRQVLITEKEGPNFAMRRFIIEAGGQMPNHTNTVEHEQFVLCGAAEIGIGKNTYQVKSGDVVFIPQGVPHWYRNTGDAKYVQYCTLQDTATSFSFLYLYARYHCTIVQYLLWCRPLEHTI